MTLAIAVFRVSRSALNMLSKLQVLVYEEKENWVY